MSDVGTLTNDGRMLLTWTVQHESGRTTLLRIGGMHPSVQDDALAIDHEVLLATIDGSAIDPACAIDPKGIARNPLATVAATLAAGRAGASNLAGGDRRRWTGRSSHDLARSLAHIVAFQRAAVRRAMPREMSHGPDSARQRRRPVHRMIREADIVILRAATPVIPGPARVPRVQERDTTSDAPGLPAPVARRRST